MALEDKELVRLYEQGQTIAALALQCGMSKEWTRKRLRKLGCERRPRGPVRAFNPSAEDLKGLYETMTLREIAELYGVGETVVWTRLKELGIAIEGKPNGHRGLPGRERSRAWKEATSIAKRGKWAGEKNPHWKGGIHQVNLRERGSGAYRQWKLKALELHGKACQKCGVAQGTTCGCCGHKISLHVHHVQSFAAHPELRYDPSNSEVLCPKCHATSHGRIIG